jgi:hypothetical protein
MRVLSISRGVGWRARKSGSGGVGAAWPGIRESCARATSDRSLRPDEVGPFDRHLTCAAVLHVAQLLDRSYGRAGAAPR